jgi:SAM-dependent methyltransferase
MKMGFSQEWEERYADNTNLSVWPWSDIVSLVHRHCKPLIVAKGGRVLELGCGAGANIPLFLALGMDYYAIEGSPTIVAQLHQRYPHLVDNIRVGDFTSDQPFDGNFDLVIDRASLTHNNTSSIKNALRISFDALKPGGVFIGSDWFSTNHTDYLGGEVADDKYTRTSHSKGQFVGVGRVHFSDEAHLRDLFSKFEILFMEEKLTRRYEPHDNHQFASWNIVAKK